MKSGASQIMGRRISGLIVKEGSSSPHSQVFLLFDDGTYYEFYANDTIRGTGGVGRGGYEPVLDYLRSTHRDPIFAVLTDPVGQKAADREVALGWIRSQLRLESIQLTNLQWALGRVQDAGFDWRTLYREALSVRPPSWSAAPAEGTLVVERD